MDVGGILGYMGLTPDVMGDDPDYEAWTKDYVGRPRRHRSGGPVGTAVGTAPVGTAQS